MDPVAALGGGTTAIALRLAAADFVVAQVTGKKPGAGYADGMPEE